MTLRKVSIVLLALLLAAMAIVPCVSAADEIDLYKIPTPNLQSDDTQKMTVISGPLSTMSGTGEFTIPHGSIVSHSSDGKTRIFDSKGKQLWFFSQFRMR